jgi:hypothetical protein
MSVPVCVLALVALCVIVAMLNGNAKKSRALSGIAIAKRGVVRRTDGKPVCHFPHRTGHAQFSFQRQGRFSSTYSLWLTVPRPPSVNQGMLRVDGAQPLQWVGVSPADPAREQHARESIQSSLHAISSSHDFKSIQLKWHGTTCVAEAVFTIRQEAAIPFWLDQMLPLADQLILALDEAIVFEKPDGPQLTDRQACPICGELVSGDGCRCQACGTAHHIECWNYNGRCAVYGCAANLAGPLGLST